MLVVDTNILVYAVDRASPYHEPMHQWVEEQRDSPSAWYLTWPVIFEFLRITTHSNVMRKPWKIVDAWSFVTALLASPGLNVLLPTMRHQAVATEIFREFPYLEGNILHDAHTAVLMREHGIRTIVTRDTGFHRFKFLEVRDPIERRD